MGRSSASFEATMKYVLVLSLLAFAVNTAVSFSDEVVEKAKLNITEEKAEDFGVILNKIKGKAIEAGRSYKIWLFVCEADNFMWNHKCKMHCMGQGYLEGYCDDGNRCTCKIKIN